MAEELHYWRRIILGLFVAFTVFFIVDALPSIPLPTTKLFGTFWIGTAIFMAISVFLSAFAGAIAARINFIGPAVLFSIVAWALLVNLVRIVHEMAGPVNVTDLVIENSLGLLAGILSAVFGALLGRWFSKKRFEIASNAT